MRQTNLNALGLITRPNQYGIYPTGANSKAQNVCFRAPGIVEAFNAVETALAAVVEFGYVIKKIFTGGWADGSNTICASQGEFNDWKLTRGTTALSYVTGTPDFETGYANGAFIRDRWFIADSRNPVAFDSVSDTTGRWAGFEAPRQITYQTATTVAAAALPAGYVSAWRCFFKRVSGSYEITGAVSNLFSWENDLGSTVDVTLKISWPNNGILIAGDTIELYRTLKQPIGTATGDEEFLSISYTLTSTDIANKYALIRDSTIDSALGASLYTNTDQLGLDHSFQVPPTATDIASFKGYTFYVATEVANSIYVRIPGKWGPLTTDAEILTGIGTRTKTGCSYTMGSPVVLVADTTGLDVGQQVSGLDFTPTVTILSIVTNTSVTLSGNALSTSGSDTGFFIDRLEISGETCVATSVLNVINTLTGHTLLTVDQTIALTGSGATSLQGANLRLSVPYAINVDISGPCTIRGTNGQNYSPKIPGITETAQDGTSDPRTNRLIFSEEDQPEACPEVNEILIGRGTIYRIIPTRDALWCFCSDGLWRLSGEGGIWRVDPVDTTLILAAPNAVDVLRDVIWAYTSRGVVGIDDSGIIEVTNCIIEDLIPNASYGATWGIFLTCDQNNLEVWLTFVSGNSSISYVYHTDQKAWSTFVIPESESDPYISATGYSPEYQAIVYGSIGGTGYDLYKFLFGPDEIERFPGSDIQFQPLTGDGDPATLKQFVDLTVLFSNLDEAETIIPYWDGTQTNEKDLKIVNTGSELASEWRATFGIPRNNAVNVSLRPGLSFDISAQPWIIRGFSIRWVQAAEESLR